MRQGIKFWVSIFILAMVTMTYGEGVHVGQNAAGGSPGECVFWISPVSIRTTPSRVASRFTYNSERISLDWPVSPASADVVPFSKTNNEDQPFFWCKCFH